MSTPRPRALPSLVLVALLSPLPLLAGCTSSGPRRPLFGGPDATPATTATPPAQPPPGARGALDRAPETDLLQQLRSARSEAEQRRIALQLVERGAPTIGLVAAARDEQALLVDLLDDVLRQLEARAAPQAARGVEAGWVEAKATLATDRFLAGDTWGALRIVDAVLALEPDTDQRDRLLRLRRRARDRILRESVLLADLVPGALTLTPADDLRARVKLTNVGGAAITLRAPTGELGSVTCDYEEASAGGWRTRQRSEHRVLIEGRELVIAPGATVELPVAIPRIHADLDPALVGRLHLGGRLRAHTFLVGEQSYPFFVPLLASDVLVVAPKDVPLVRDPAAGLAAALEAGTTATGKDLEEAGRRAFVAVLAIARDDPQAAIDAAATALERDDVKGGLADALCSGLARAQGEPLSFTRAEWLAWYRARRASRPEREAPGPR